MILADEPTGNLDSASGGEIMQILDQLHQRGRTVIIVTHDPKIAARTQRTIHLLDGRIEREENHRSGGLS
jgi:ABC-type lipoprotein export system ATPase subunit